ncbi:Hypothetical protein ACI5QL_03974 [Bacillus velezensis]
MRLGVRGRRGGEQADAQGRGHYRFQDVIHCNSPFSLYIGSAEFFFS